MSNAATPALQGDSGGSMFWAKRYQSGEWIGPHSHACARILLSGSGVMSVEYGKEAVVVPPHHALWLPSGIVHAICMMGPVEVRALYLRDSDIRQLPEQPAVLATSGLLGELIKTIPESEAVRSEE